MYRALSRKVLVSTLLAVVVVWAGCSELPTGPDSSGELVTGLNRQIAPHGVPTADIEPLDLGTLGGAWSEAYAVNNDGWVVGVSQLADGKQHAFLWTVEDGMQDLNGDGWSFSRAEGVNNNGTVVGWGIYAGKIQGFVWTETTGMTSVGIPSVHRSSYCFGVNDAGLIVGMALSTSGNWNAIVWSSPTNLTILGSLGGTASRALDINEAGRVSGKSTLSNQQSRAVMWVPQNPTVNLGTLGGAESEAFGLNEASLVVGWAHDADGRKRPFLWDGTLHDLGTLGGPNGEAYEVSESGWVVGDAENGNLQLQPVLWTDAGIVELPTLGGATGHARDLSESGVIAGYSELESGDRHATIWVVDGEEPPPQDPAEDLRSEIDLLIEDGVLTAGQGWSLFVKIGHAEKQIEQGKIKTAENILGALVNQIEALVRSRRLSQPEGDYLIALIEQWVESLET